MKVGPNDPCPCGRGPKFKRCCRPYLAGAPAPDPESLMRSRYTAYLLGEVDHILRTTDPAGPHFEEDEAGWRESVVAFSRGTCFEGLEVLEAEVEGDEGRVRFRAALTRGGEDVGFEEDSSFRRVGGRWLYSSGSSLSKA